MLQFGSMFIVLLIVVGLVLGSFITAFVDRLHDGRDWVKGRSECDSCREQLEPRDLVPVMSWLVNMGRCRMCGARVSWRYPATELSLVTVFVVSYIFWPYTFAGIDIARFVLWCVILVGFVAMSMFDFRWMIIPNKILYPLIAITILFVLIESVFYGGGAKLVQDTVLGLVACGGIFFGLYQVSEGRWIGGGDVKLGFLLGLLVAGLYEGLLVIMLASFIGVAVSLPALVTRKLNVKTHIPFGPVLMLSTVIVFLFGSQIIDWYLHDFLLL